MGRAPLFGVWVLVERACSQLLSFSGIKNGFLGGSSAFSGVFLLRHYTMALSTKGLDWQGMGSVTELR